MIEIGGVNEVGGERAIVLADVVTEREPSGATFARLGACPDGQTNFWLDEDQIREVREAHPDLPIFGFWQLLFFNDCVDLNLPLQVAALREDAGFFIQIEDGSVVETGQYRGTTIMELDQLVSQLPHVQIDTWDMVLPAQSAALASELGAERRRENRQRYIRWGVYAAIGLVGFGAINYVLTAREAQRESTYQHLESRRNQVTRALGELRKTRDVPGMAPEHQTRNISRLLELVYRADYITLEETTFDTENWHVVVGQTTHLPAWADDVTPEPTDTVMVSWPGG